MNCNATLMTSTVEPCPNEYMSYAACEYPKQTWACTGTQHVTLHMLACDAAAGHPPDSNGRDFHRSFARPDNTPLPQFVLTWQDDTPGATPHVEPEPAVTDAMVDAYLHAPAYGDEREDARLAIAAALAAQKDE